MIFPSTLGDFKGIINHLKKYSLPSVSINATLGNFNAVNDFVDHKENSNIVYQDDNNKPISVIFDFCRFRINVTDYLIETGSHGSPPVIWQLSGANELNEKWTIIDSPPQHNTLCPIVSGTTQCNERTISRWKCNSSSSAYRYIRFTVIKDRYGINEVYLRLGGLEFYGGLYSTSKFNCTIKVCKKSKAFVYVIIVCLLIS